MYKHFFKHNLFRFLILFGSVFALLVTLNIYTDENYSLDFSSNLDLTLYYGVTMTFLVVSGVCIKGFNNRLAIILVAATTGLELLYYELIFYLIYDSYNLYILYTIYFVPSFLSLLLFHYRTRVVHYLASRFVKYRVFDKKAFSILEKNEETNFTAAILWVLRLSLFVCFAVTVVMYHSMWYFDLPANGPALMRVDLFWVAVGMPDLIKLLGMVWHIQTYCVVALMLHTCVSEHYIKDLNGFIPRNLFKKSKVETV